MITLFQESVPFTNKKLNSQISQDGSYTNPVIMPYAFNANSDNNTLETVIYIKNDDPTAWYKNVVIALMKEDVGTATVATGVLNYESAQSMYLTLPSSSEKLYTDIVYEDYLYNSSVVLQSKYMSTYIPVSIDDVVEVKFSYGYDEQSNYNWSTKKSAILIPYVGNSTLVDMSYIPIRMRIKFLAEPTSFTLRDYFIDVSYESEEVVTG